MYKIKILNSKNCFIISSTTKENATFVLLATFLLLPLKTKINGNNK